MNIYYKMLDPITKKKKRRRKKEENINNFRLSVVTTQILHHLHLKASPAGTLSLLRSLVGFSPLDRQLAATRTTYYLETFPNFIAALTNYVIKTQDE
jgi:hypothetical protein